MKRHAGGQARCAPASKAYFKIERDFYPLLFKIIDLDRQRAALHQQQTALRLSVD
jgi:hypothetical protein